MGNSNAYTATSQAPAQRGSCIEEVLGRLQGVYQTRPGKWVARCPAHDDKTPSLSIREAEDGRVLLYCWAGCPTERVLAALGLSWRDLFPESGTARPRTPEERQEAARRKAETILERRWRELAEATARDLAGLIQRAHWLLANGGWQAIMEGGPGADYLAGLAHQLSFWEFIFDEVCRREPEPWAVVEAKKVVGKWA